MPLALVSAHACPWDTRFTRRCTLLRRRYFHFVVVVRTSRSRSRAAAEPGGLTSRARHAALRAAGRRRMRHRLPRAGKMGERRIVRAAVLGLVLGAGACYCYRLWRRAVGRGRRRAAPCVPPSGEEGEEKEDGRRGGAGRAGSAVSAGKARCCGAGLQPESPLEKVRTCLHAFPCNAV